MPRADRLLALLSILGSRRAVTMSELTSKLETSQRSVYRDLADLEARGFPLERGEGTYRVMEGATVRPIPLTDRERLILTLALENGTLGSQPAFAKTLKSLRAKLKSAHALPESVVSVSGPDRSGAVPESVVDHLEQAIRLRHSVSILYHSLLGKKRTWRGLDPWLVVHRCDAWYVVGRCHTHDEPRVFRLDRIGQVLPIGSTFERPEIDPEQFFDGSWGVVKTNEKNDVVIHFSEGVAPLIVNAQHHPGESKDLLEDGTVEYRVRIGALQEIARWVCGFGGNARVVAPPALAQMVLDIASGAAAAHRQARAAMTIRAPRKKS